MPSPAKDVVRATSTPQYSRLPATSTGAPVGFTSNIEAIKGAIPIEEYAATLTSLRKAGDKLTGLCPLPDHDEKTPSFCVYPEDQHFHCYGCEGHGDLLDLHQAVTGDELPEALVELSMRYGVELPGRPDAWHRKNARQQPLRDGVDQVRANIVQRRMFRIFRTSYLDHIEDEELRREEAEHIWRELEAPARAYARQIGASHE